jgi:hypothetical protein
MPPLGMTDEKALSPPAAAETGPGAGHDRAIASNEHWKSGGLHAQQGHRPALRRPRAEEEVGGGPRHHLSRHPLIVMLRASSSLNAGGGHRAANALKK